MSKVSRYTVLIEHDPLSEGSWSAYCPDLPGCVAAGATEDEVLDLMHGALAMHLEGIEKDGDLLPPSTVRAVEFAVRVPAALAKAA